ncbi:MAG: transcription elongation factor GreA [Candidatus Paceibacterota bacterium]|jgi:transcription elongation factor GreA
MIKYFTQEGHHKLKEELKIYLERRSQIARRIEEAKALGDLSENADYIKSKEEQAFNEGKIREIENMLTSAELIKENGDNCVIGMNSSVKFKDKEGKIYEYKIVGSGESDPLSGRISYETPLGKQFLGKKVGDAIEVNIPSGKKVYKIMEIN